MPFASHSECDIPYVRDYSNRLGDQITKNYNKSKNKEPGGRCYEVCHARVRTAARQVCSQPLPALDPNTPFGRLWGSLIKPKESWLELPEAYRGKGAAGAMAWANLGTLLDSAEIWSGGLKAGAVIQTWRVAGDYIRVREGTAPTSYGHSFIFLKYVYKGKAIAGMRIADQGVQNGDTLKRGDYGFWVAANTLCFG